MECYGSALQCFRVLLGMARWKACVLYDLREQTLIVGTVETSIE